MNTKTTRQLTPYDTKIYFVPDTRALEQRRSQLQAINAQLDRINAQKKYIAALKLKGLQIGIIDITRIGILAITYLFITLHTSNLLDPRWWELVYWILPLYWILLLVEIHFIRKPEKSKKIYGCLSLLIGWITISFGALIYSRHPDVAWYFCICGISHIYPLYVGIKSLYTARKKEKINLEEERQKRGELNNIQQKQIHQVRPPTDQEFDAWLESRVKERLTITLRKLGLNDQIANHRQLLRVRGYVLPGMKDARHYRPQDLRYKLGTDGKRRYSLNLYTYFYPADHQIMVFTYEINAMNWDEGRETTKEYFYHDVIGAETVDDRDKLWIEGKQHNYRTQSFRLKLCDGTAISATMRSRPLDDMASLPVFDIPQSDIDQTIAQLRMLLRTKKA